MEFQEIKDIIVARAKEASASQPEYRRALKAENERELLQVIVDNMEWKDIRKIIDANILEKFSKDALHDFGIYVRYVGDLTITKGSDFFDCKIGKIQSLENSTINYVRSRENSTINYVRSRENSTITMSAAGRTLPSRSKAAMRRKK